MSVQCSAILPVSAVDAAASPLVGVDLAHLPLVDGCGRPVVDGQALRQVEAVLALHVENAGEGLLRLHVAWDPEVRPILVAVKYV